MLQLYIADDSRSQQYFHQKMKITIAKCSTLFPYETKSHSVSRSLEIALLLALPLSLFFNIKKLLFKINGVQD